MSDRSGRKPVRPLAAVSHPLLHSSLWMEVPPDQHLPVHGGQYHNLAIMLGPTLTVHPQANGYPGLAVPFGGAIIAAASHSFDLVNGPDPSTLLWFLVKPHGDKPPRSPLQIVQPPLGPITQSRVHSLVRARHLPNLAVDLCHLTPGASLSWSASDRTTLVVPIDGTVTAEVEGQHSKTLDRTESDYLVVRPNTRFTLSNTTTGGLGAPLPSQIALIRLRA